MSTPAASPYEGLPPSAFWRAGVQRSSPQGMFDLYPSPKTKLQLGERIATAGSCFAQHIAKRLRSSGFSVLDVEPAPPALSLTVSRDYGYNLYSARYGNIYTTRQLVQLLEEATGRTVPADPVWQKGDRFYDAQRPNVEPLGLDSPEEVLAHRKEHLRAIGRMIRSVDVFVFTMGLTETWMDQETGTVFPTAPGTIAGTYDPDRYVFKNFTYGEVRADFLRARRLLKRYSPDCRFLITVSPVPLTATASGGHVLRATTYSKSTLRAVAGDLHAEFDDIDYFPSYEIITNPAARSSFFEPSLRSVAEEGVESVMRVFLAAHEVNQTAPEAEKPVVPEAAAVLSEPVSDEGDEIVCEEMLLDAFGR